MRLAGRTALVTGAAGGIGAAIATLFGSEGAHVTGLDLAGTDIDCDVADREAVDAALGGLGGLDVLVHAAALLGGTGGFLDVAMADWRRTLSVNLDGAFHVCQAAARIMAASGRGGAIVTIGSVNSLAAEPGAAQYVASKAGVLGLTRAMAVDLAAYGIRVNMIAPGPIEVPRNAALFAAPPLQDAFRRLVPQRRAGTAGAVAQAALFLAEPTSDFVTGSVVTVDGGLLAQILRVE